MAEKKYQNWQLEKDKRDILWLYFDKKNSAVNVLSAEVLEELGEIIEKIEQDSTLKGLILASAKKSGFIAGANIEEFSKFKDEQDAFELVRKVQIYFQRIEALKIPTVAIIDGFCLGGGTELALSYRYRVAEDGPKTRIGLPEVLLGVNPGWGGTVRLPRLIGAPAAMDLILTGRTVSGRAAAKLGIVDVAVPRRQLKRAACYYVLQKPKPHEASFLQKLSNASVIRPIVARQIYKTLRKKVKRDHYPAPYAIVDNWVKNGVYGEQAFIDEAKTIAHFFFHPTSKNLVRVFFLQERLKGLSKGVKFSPRHVHVIGAGTMGGDIAAWCALNGLHVTLQDREPKYIAPAIKRAYELFKEKLKTPREIQAAMDRLFADPEGYGIKKADIIIEAIFENLEAKQKLFQDIERKAKPDAILATNTSSIPLDEINQVLTHPERLVGIHFFNPVAKMKLVEVVEGEKTSPEIFKEALAFVRRIDRLPLPVKSSPGFLVNRMLMPYLMEGMVLLNEKVPPEEIDRAAVNFGMPMGPIELADTVGLDICLSVAENLSKHFNIPVPERLREMVKNKELGRKTGKGFYVYKDGRPIKNPSKQGHETPDLADRLILPMLNEGVACLREGVVADADLLDAGMIYGTGWAPFRGGAMHYVKNHGKEAIKQKLIALQQKYGDRFKPDQGWESVQI
jgi:3-hydroxyacyl-CoA dehydrogenase/enoyl-CoA hydratase/3-hydroxybutyryl-CoA epimerase